MLHGPEVWRLGRETMQARLCEHQERFGDLSIRNQLQLAFGPVAVCRRNFNRRSTKSAILPPLALKTTSLTEWRPRQPQPSRCFVPIVGYSERVRNR